MYLAKIAGSRYVCALENVQGQWYLRMKLDDVVEADVAVTHMTKRALHANMGTLFEKVNLQVNPIQHDLLHKEIVSQITHLLAANDGDEDPSSTTTIEIKEDPRIDQLSDKINTLEKELKLLKERLDRVEQLTSS